MKWVSSSGMLLMSEGSRAVNLQEESEERDQVNVGYHRKMKIRKHQKEKKEGRSLGKRKSKREKSIQKKYKNKRRKLIMIS